MVQIYSLNRKILFIREKHLAPRKSNKHESRKWVTNRQMNGWALQDGFAR